MTPWKPSTEQPKRATVAIIATMPPEFDSFALLADLYVYRSGSWVSEVTGDSLDTDTPYWWCAEDDLLAHLETVAASRRNGHNATERPQ